MGLGKTVLMATCIFYEFLLANKYPRDPRFCHNALVFAPDKTVLQSLKEIQTFDKTKVVPPEYVNWLETHLRFHFLDEGVSMNLKNAGGFTLVPVSLLQGPEDVLPLEIVTSLQKSIAQRGGLSCHVGI